MKNKLSLNRMFIYVLALLLPCLPLSATTYSLNTEISTTTVPNASISSFLDSNHNTHVAWVATTQTGEQVMYGKYTSDGVFTSATVSEVFYRVGSLSIVTDDSDNPHITYFIKRDSNPEYTFTRTGNYAVYYAGSTNGGTSFTNEQVSTNVADRTDNSDGIYHSYVNGRPQIGINTGGQVQILYSSDSNTLNSYSNWAIIAVRSGANSWSRTQEFDIDALVGTFSHDSEFEMLPRPTSNNTLAWIDISNYDPQFISNKTNTTISGYSGSFDNKHAQIDVDDSGNIHYFWLQDASDTVAFHHTILNGNSYGTVDQIDIATEPDGSLKSVTGNLRPATVDPVTGKLYLIYYEGIFGSVSGTFLIEYDPATMTSQEFELTDVGVAYGKRSLNVHNGFISYVGGSSGSTLYISHLNASSLGVVNAAPTISGTPASNVTSGQSYSFTPVASDTDGDNLTYSISNMPAWASFITSTGTLSGTPQAGDINTYTGITISVSDGTDTVSLQTFSITVDAVVISNTPPTISGTPDTSVTVDQSYSFTPVANDADADNLTFAITNPPIWAGFDTSTGTLSGTPQAGDENTYSGISISVTDGTDTVSLPSFSITVSAVASANTPPTISGTPVSSLEVGQSYSFTPTTGDGDSDVLNFTSTNLPEWLTLDAASGTITGTPQTGQDGVYSDIVISVSDGIDTVSLAAFSIEVTTTAAAAPDEDTTPASSGGSGGGSLTPYWLLLILLQFWLRRR